LRAKNDDLVAKKSAVKLYVKARTTKRVGKSSRVYLGQGELFDETEEPFKQAVVDVEETITFTRHKPKRKNIC
jgi:hypothetical protein